MIEVRFKGNRREYFTWPSADSSSLRLDVPVIVEVERGQDFGAVSALNEIAVKKCERCGACGGGSGLGVREFPARSFKMTRRMGMAPNIPRVGSMFLGPKTWPRT